MKKPSPEWKNVFMDMSEKESMTVRVYTGISGIIFGLYGMSFIDWIMCKIYYGMR